MGNLNQPLTIKVLLAIHLYCSQGSKISRVFLHSERLRWLVVGVSQRRTRFPFHPLFKSVWISTLGPREVIAALALGRLSWETAQHSRLEVMQSKQTYGGLWRDWSMSSNPIFASIPGEWDSWRKWKGILKSLIMYWARQCLVGRTESCTKICAHYRKDQ